MLKTARNVHLNAVLITANGEHSEMKWMVDPLSSGQFGDYLTYTLKKAEDYKKVSSLVTLHEYLNKYRSSLSRSEKRLLIDRVKDFALSSCREPKDFDETQFVPNWPEQDTVCDTSFSYIITDFQLAESEYMYRCVREEIISAKYAQALQQNNLELAEKWVKFAEKNTDSKLGPELRKDLSTKPRN